MRQALRSILPQSPMALGALLLVTAAVIFIPLERTNGDLGSTLDQFVFFLTTAVIYAIFCIGLNVQWGYTGVFNFGISGFFLVGAYTSAIIVKGDPPPVDPVTGNRYVDYIGGFGDDLSLGLGSDQWLPFLVAILAAAAVAGILALLIGLTTLKLRDDYLAITTIGIAELLRAIATEEPDLVNSSAGLPGIPAPFEDWFSSATNEYVFLGLLIALIVVIYFAIERGIRSPWGRVLRAVREDDHMAEASGKNTVAFRMQAFVVGAMIMGVGGALYGYERHTLAPETFLPISTTFLIWTMLMVGGSGNNKGAILGAYVVYGFYFVTGFIQSYDPPEWINTTRISAFRDLTVGSLIVLVLLLRPQGLLPEEARVSIWVDRFIARTRREKPPPAVSETD